MFSLHAVLVLLLCLAGMAARDIKASHITVPDDCHFASSCSTDQGALRTFESSMNMNTIISRTEDA